MSKELLVNGKYNVVSKNIDIRVNNKRDRHYEVVNKQMFLVYDPTNHFVGLAASESEADKLISKLRYRFSKYE
jgi:hypothetical protein